MVQRLCIALTACPIFMPTVVHAESGVSPQAVSLPSGPGSLEGLGESFQPQLNSGTFSYRIPLKLPPIRGGAPQLALLYSSGNGNGVLGQGWSLRLPCVRRQTDKGLPQYIDTDLFYDENAEELVHLADGSYRQKIESLFIRYERTPNGGWLGRLANGSVLSFGSTNQSRLDWTGQRTFCWMVDSSQDPNGNRTEYSYFQDGQQIYPQEIRYGVHASQSSAFFSIQFGYSTNRPDPFVDCRPRFASTNQLRLQTITVFFGARRIRQWQFGYDTNAALSLLTSVTQFGDERSATGATAQVNVDYLPPTRFAYAPYTLVTQPQVQTIWFDPNEPNFAFGGEDGGSTGNFAEFVDINHDGLPDILVNSGDQWRSLLNPGRFTNAWPVSVIITNPPSVTGVNLGQSSTRLVDLRGDGRAKLMVAQDGSNPDGSTAFYYYDFLSPTTLGPPQPYFTSNGITLGQAEVQFVDLDDDKAMDLVRINAGGGFLEGLYTRMFEGNTNQYLTTQNPYGFDFTQGWQLADMNGDRLQDFVFLNGTDNTEISLNLGWGQFAPPYLMSGGPDLAALQTPGTSGPRLVDLNQDGLADLVIVENGDVRIWLNQNGTSWSDPIVITGTPSYQSGQTIVRFADVNGNGSIDIIWHSGQDPFIQYIDLFPAGKAGLLNHGVTTLGRSLDIIYKSSTDYMSEDAGTTNQWTVAAPFPVPVISQIIEGDGLGNLYTNQFTYRNAYYDGLEREFRGFEQATQAELGDDSQGAPTLITRFQFDTGSINEALKGKPLRVEADTVTGSVFYRQTNFWLPRQLILTDAPGETRTVTFAFENRKLTEDVELGPESNAIIVEEEFDYDNFGNQTFHADYGRVENGDRAAWNDERIITRQFSAEFPSGTNLWLLDRLVEEETADINGNVAARKQVFYDDQAFAGNNFGTVTLGNATLIREWIDIPNNVFRSSCRQTFDLYGNVTDIYDPLGFPGQAAVGHYRHIDFDSQIHTHAVQEAIYTANPDAIAAGSLDPSLVIHAGYDIGLGVLSSATDFNQSSTVFGFDTFGRLVMITKPYDTTNLPTALFSYVLQQPVSARQIINFSTSNLRTTAGKTNTFNSRAFFDGLGRKIMTRTQSETNGAVVISDGTLFNRRRTTWRSFLPYFETGTLDYAPVVQTGDFVETYHDALGRETVKSQPPTPPEDYRAFSQTTYGPLMRILQDEEQTRAGGPHYGAGMSYTEDGLLDQNGKGRLRLVGEIVHLSDTGVPTPGSNTWTTRYQYDVLDDLLGYTDSQGNQKIFGYDALKRKIFMNDPDRGIMQWSYDLASNIRNTLDAKGQQILYNYDGVNRLLTEKYLDGLAPPPWRSSSANPQLSTNFSVIYHYDLPLPNVPVGDGTFITAQNTLGKLAWVEDLSGEEHTGYDTRGRIAFTVKRIPDPVFLPTLNPQLSTPLVSYRTALSCDSLDRVTTLTYPDNDVITYTYNNRNLPAGILGGINGLTRAGAIVEAIAYHASAQLDSIVYGNGVVTHYGYDPRLRLSSILTVSQPSSLNQQLINFAYDFDDASNIKTIHDNRPTSVVPAGDPRRNTQLFAYDDLYRITYAGYCFGPPGSTNVNGGSINYNYDRIGNMLAQNSPIADTDSLTGLPVANLGAMSSGGALGAWNRTGRAPTDAPGPHALTAIQNAFSPIQNRLYPYDANGNMTIIDGFTNTWDFKDRLISTENAQMRAEYTYDYTDRRIIKKVTGKSPPSFPSSLKNLNQGSFTTVYIGKHFEVREHDAPTKYVFNGDTRVARVIGSLSTNLRVQRWRIFPGWNLCSIAVTAINALHQLLQSSSSPSLGLDAFQYISATQSWSPVSPAQTLNAGAVIWLRASTNTTLAAVGTYSDPVNGQIPSGTSFSTAAGLEVWSPGFYFLTNALFAMFNPLSNHWQFSLNRDLAVCSDLPDLVSPGGAFFARATQPMPLQAPDSGLRIRYYHQDHLSSSSCLTDSAGNLINETDFYAFGKPRYENIPRKIDENFKFTQKERDEESGFSYFEKRFLLGGFGRFESVDALVNAQDRLVATRFLHNPQEFNCYAYAANNPISRIDPTGSFSLKKHLDMTVNAAVDAGLSEMDIWHFYKEVVAVTHPDLGYSPSGVWSPITLYQSHLGSKQIWHSMAPEGMTDATQVKSLILAEAKKLWEAGKIGFLAHMIEDSYSESHVQRDATGKILRFQDYEAQDHSAHAQADEGDTSKAQEQATRLFKLYKAGASWEDVSNWLNADVYRTDEYTKAGGSAPAYEKQPTAIENGVNGLESAILRATGYPP